MKNQVVEPEEFAKVSEGINPYLEGNFAPVHEEVALENLPVHGQIPLELRGRLLRIGPNPVTAPDPTSYHWFIGNGMVHGIEIKDGRALAYRNRYVVDRQVAQVLDKPEIGGPARSQDFPVNTNVLRINGRTYAFVEAGGLPIELDRNLNSIARSDFDGTLAGGFTAHPHLDPESGEYHALAYQAGNPVLHYIVVDKTGAARVVSEISAPHMPMVHDIAITKSFLIVLDLPVHFSIKLAQQGKFPFAWKDGAQSRIGLLPRSGEVEKLQWFALPTCYVFHIMNAYERRTNEVVVDVVKHSKTFAKYTDGPREGKINLVRWIINRTTGSVSETELCNRGLEFPRINEAYTGSDYQYGYTAMFAGGLRLGSVQKHDVRHGSTAVHDFGRGQMAGEPVFIPASQSSKFANCNAEDCGWVMTCVYDDATDTSSIHILDAQNFAGEAVAIIDLPVRVPFGFHGNWLPD